MEKSKEKMAQTLIKRGYSIPAKFQVDATSKVHPSVQTAFAANLGKDGTLKGDFGGTKVWGYEPHKGYIAGSGKSYLFLGTTDGGNYTIFTWNYSDQDPAIYLCDSNEDWDSEKDEPKNGRKLTGSLSAFITKLRPDSPPIKKQKGDISILSAPEIIGKETSSEILATNDNCILTKASGSLVLVEIDDEGHHEYVLGSAPEGVVEFALDRRNVFTSIRMDGGGEEIYWNQREENGWTERKLIYEIPSEKGFNSMSCGGDFLALSWEEDDIDIIQTLVYKNDKWTADSRFSQEDERWFRFSAFDDSGDVTRMVLASWNTPHVYTRVGDLWEKMELDYPMHHDVSSVDIRGNILVVGCKALSSREDEFGWIADHSRSDSGSVLVFELTGNNSFGPARHLKGSSKQQSGGVTHEGLGRKVVAGDGWILADGAPAAKGKLVFRVFAFDPQIKRWIQNYQEDGTDFRQAYSQNMVVNLVNLRYAHGPGMVQVRRFLPEVTTTPFTSVPPIEPKRMGIINGRIDPDLKAVFGLAKTGENQYLTMSTHHVVFFDGEGTYETHALAKPISSITREGVIRCGNDLLLVHSDKLYELKDKGLHEVDIELQYRAKIIGGDWGFLIRGESRRFDTSKKPSESADFLKDVEWIIQNTDGFVMASPTKNTVALYDTSLKETQVLAPQKPVKQFGSGLTLHGDTLYVGSGSGVHVFEREGKDYEEVALVKMSRNKKGGDGFVQVYDDLMVVGCQTLNRGTGAIVIFDWVKKKWKKRFELSDYNYENGGYHTILDGRRLIVARRNRTAPIQIYDL